MALTEHLASFLVDFGVDGVLAGFSVRGIFDNGAGQALGGLVAGSTPTFQVPTANITGLALGAAATISGVSYTVAEIAHDGTGMSLLTLEAN